VTTPEVFLKNLTRGVDPADMDTSDFAHAAGQSLLDTRPKGRVNVLSVVAAAVIAAVAVLLVQAFAGSLPRISSALPALFLVAAAGAGVSAYLLACRARAISDGRLAWMAAGFGISGLAMVLTAIALPPWAQAGGMLRTTPGGLAGLYLVCHLALPIFALGAVSGGSRRLRWVFGVVSGTALLVVATWRGLPVRLLGAHGRYTPVFVAGLVAVASLGALAAWLWLRAAGRRPTWIEAWIGAALLLSSWDAGLQALSGHRLSSMWWASLSIRVTQYAVLTGAMLRGFASLHESMNAYADRLVAVTERLEEKASRDWLTGLLNRAAFHELAEAAVVDPQASGHALVFFDLDGFKEVNDAHGHAAGDRLLVTFTEALRSSGRAGDLVARLGGDEFVTLLPGATIAEALELDQRIRRCVRGAVQFSSGITAWRISTPLAVAIRTADELMYEAKRVGDTCVSRDYADDEAMEPVLVLV
jgi:diguanylate cyclase (GGDEF)-like protein